MIPAGELRNRITIQSSSRADDGGGGGVLTWGVVAVVWAKIHALNGTERFRAQQIASELTHKVTIRYRTGITPQQRVQFEGRVFRIEAVLNLEEKNEALELYCREEDI